MNVQEFISYQELEIKLKDELETVKYLRTEAHKRFPARAARNKFLADQYYKQVDFARSKLSEAERIVSGLKSEVYSLRKIASLGVGEWIKEEVAKARIGGSSRSYNHPEFGIITHYTFGGWSMQRVAASASVEWHYNGKDYRREWSGKDAREASKKYLKNTFGIR